VGIGVLAVLSYLVSLSPYYVNIWTNGLLFAGLALAWNIIGGFGGQFSLGHAVFFGIGAYSTVLLSSIGWGTWAPIGIGVVIATLVAWALAAPLFRLRGHFFAIATLALTVVCLALANYVGFTGGPRGAQLPLDSLIFQNPTNYVWLMLAYVALATIVATVVKHGRVGYALFGVRDNQEGARSVGVNPRATKTQGLLISAALTGLGGGLFAQFTTFVNPGTAFDIEHVGIRLPLLALIGGLGTVYGPVIGGLVMEPVAKLLEGEFGGEIPGLAMMIFAALLILAALFFKNGIAGAIRRVGVILGRRWGRYGGSRRTTERRKDSLSLRWVKGR
jgi:branched-chain amino acid transport system permease protein